MSNSIPQPEITRDTFVGRKDELDIIKEAILDKGNLRIVNIQGAGGIGKTSILREVQERYSWCDDLLVTDIIDFFDIATNTEQGCRDAIVEKIEKVSEKELPESEIALLYEMFEMFDLEYHLFHEDAFYEYKKARDRYNEIELAGLTADTLKHEKDEMLNNFYADYNRLINRKRIVLLIDTFEMVQKSLGKWLADFLKELKNTAVIIAGRENKKWQTIIGDKLSKYIELKEFNDEDTKELFGLSEAGKLLSDEEREKIKLLSGGLPILLILSVDENWPGGLSGQRLTFDRYELQALEQMTGLKLKTIQDEFRIELLERFNQGDIFGMVVNCMALIYKYFTVDILSYLMQMSKKESQNLLTDLKKWTFIKYNNSTDSYQVHDLIRDLIMKHIYPVIDRTGEERKKIYQRTVKLYDDMFKNIAEQESKQQEYKKQAGLKKDKAAELTAMRKLTNLKKKRQQFEAQQVYYWILADQREGLFRYQEVFVDNVWGRGGEAISLVRQERNSALRELGQIYPKHEKQLEIAKIRIAMQGKFNKGLDILKALSNKVSREDDPYFYSDILLYQGIASVYQGKFREAEEKFKDTITILEKLRDKLNEPENSENLESRRIMRSFARVYGNMGYALMMAGRYSEAVKAYQDALRYTSNETMLQKASYLNDLGFSYARLGEYEQGRYFCKEGLKIREKFLIYYSYSIGLSYNTLGLIEYHADHSYEGEVECQKALDIFKRIEDQRGIGLACRSIGGLLARTGQRKSSEDILKQAEDYLEKAESIFKEGGEFNEPLYLAEIYDRFGLLYLNRSELSGKDSEYRLHHLERARDYINKALEKYDSTNCVMHQLTVLSRLGKILFEEGKIEEANEQLKKMEEIILNETNGKSLKEIKNERQEILYPWGRLERGKASLAFDRFWKSEKKNEDDLKESAKHYTLACSYLEMFSKNTFATKATLNEIGERIKQLEKKDREIFRDKVEKTLEEHELEDYREILKRIEDTEISL